MRRIGFFDSGIGGLSVLRHALTHIADADYLYFADSGYAPYGKRSPSEVSDRSLFIARYLRDQGVQALVIACNTATALAAESIREDLDIPVIAIEPAVKPAAVSSPNGKVGVLATATTLASRRYLDLKGRYGKGIEWYEFAPHHWIEAIEKGAHLQPGFAAMVRQDLSPLLTQGIDTWLLACTHFPIVYRQIVAAVGADAKVIDPAPAVTAELQRRLPERNQERRHPHRRGLKLLTSGDPSLVESLAEQYLARALKVVRIT